MCIRDSYIITNLFEERTKSTWSQGKKKGWSISLKWLARIREIIFEIWLLVNYKEDLVEWIFACKEGLFVRKIGWTKFGWTEIGLEDSRKVEVF